MGWTEEKVERALLNSGSLSSFIENNGRLKVEVCGESLLFFANCNDTVSAYYEYLPVHSAVACTREFCKYAIPYLEKILIKHRDEILPSEYCIKTIRLDY